MKIWKIEYFDDAHSYEDFYRGVYEYNEYFFLKRENLHAFLLTDIENILKVDQLYFEPCFMEEENFSFQDAKAIAEFIEENSGLSDFCSIRLVETED